MAVVESIAETVVKQYEIIKKKKIQHNRYLL